MRPYLAIIKDSFRAAMASRVLYVLLILITFFLLVLAPAFVRETLDWRLVLNKNVKNPDQLMSRLVERREKNKGVGRIWDLLSVDLKNDLLARQSKSGDQSEDSPDKQPDVFKEIGLQENLISQLNAIIERRDFYQEEDWKGRRGLNPEAKDLIKDGVDKLSDIRVNRLNRLLISSAVSPAIDTGTSTAMEVRYAIWRIFTYQGTHQQFAQYLLTLIPGILDKFVLSLGLLIALIVTSNLVPETFEPGSLNLLLSKPISRWGLYTAKFWGGCVFIGLCATYLFIGVWLWLGFGMGVWDRAILFCIPLYIIVFGIYFSVSALIGLLWRSPIVSIILTALFWAACFSVGSLFGITNNKMSNQQWLAIVPVGDKVLGVDLLHRVNQWDQNSQTWVRKLGLKIKPEEEVGIEFGGFLGSFREENGAFGQLIKPMLHAKSNRILTSQLEFPFPTGNKPLYASDENGDDFRSIGNFPAETIKAWSVKNSLVAVTSAGKFHQLNDQQYDEALLALNTAGKGREKEVSIPKQPETKGKKEKTSLFDLIGPEEAIDIANRNHVEYSESRDEFAIYSKAGIKIYHRQESGFQLKETIEIKLEFDVDMTTMLGFGKKQLVLAFGNGTVRTISLDGARDTRDFHLEKRSAIQEIFSSPDGDFFAVLYRNGNLWTWNSISDQEFVIGRLPAQGDISSFAFGKNGKCWVGYDSDQIAAYDLINKKVESRYAPSGGFMNRAFRYGVRPLYRIFPKPGEFYKLVKYLASSNLASSTNQSIDFNKAAESADPWGPLWSGLLFMFGMLALGCTVFHFRDY